MRRGLRLGLALATVATAFAAATGSASAGLLDGVTGSLSNCGYGSSSPVFLPWLDPLSYSLAPQGDLSSTSGWTLAGATRSSAHDPYGLSKNSLVFTRNGQSATTPWMCVTLQNPTLRFLTLDKGGLGLGSFALYLHYRTPDGSEVRLLIGTATAGGSWQPTLPNVLALNLLSIASSNGQAQIALEIQAQGLLPGETLSADGFYVDPCRSI